METVKLLIDEKGGCKDVLVESNIYVPFTRRPQWTMKEHSCEGKEKKEKLRMKLQIL